MNLNDKKKLWLKANKLYNNGGSTVMTDAEFDLLEKQIKKEDPEWLESQSAGAKINKKTEVALEFFMSSLTKIYPEKIEKWTEKQKKDSKYIVHMDKLDGSALQVTYNKCRAVKVVTRGDGTRGGDISFLIPYLNLPMIQDSSRTVLRCEALMTEKIFQKKYADDYDNARNTVNGWLNRMKPHKGLADIDIVVLGVYDKTMMNGLLWAQTQGLKTVAHDRVLLETLDPQKILEQRRKKSGYKIDGLVLVKPSSMFAYADADKPKWIVAFKQNTDLESATQAIVKKIIWQDSRKSRLIPKIEIEPVRIDGSTVTYCTAHNAKWMMDRGIGPGALVQIVKSGDVIPKIVGIIKKAKIQLPLVPHKLVGVHFEALARSTESSVREIHNFFKVLGIEFIASSTIEMLFTEGYTSAHDYMKTWARKDYKALQSAGVGKVMSQKIFAEFDRVFGPGLLLKDLMVASNCFAAGIGDRKLTSIQKHYSGYNILARLLVTDESEHIEMLEPVPGLADKSIDLISAGLEKFKPWLRTAMLYVTIRKPEIVKHKITGKLRGQKISFTGYRDKAEEEWIVKNGGEVVDFGAQTEILLFRPSGKTSSKIKKAEAKGIQILMFKALK